MDEDGLRRAVEAAGGRLDERMVKDAEAWAALASPDLPLAAARTEEIEAFERDLTALCRRHGLFLREATPNGMVLYRAYGDETGYGFRPIGPHQYVATRRL